MKRSRVLAAAAVALSLASALAGCSRADSGDSGSAPASSGAPSAGKGPAAELRLGYFPNVTHTPALVGLEKGLFTKELGSTKLVPTKFNAGGEAVNALYGGSLDATFIGSGPSLNAYGKSDGKAVRLVAGTASRGAQLVVKPEINSEQDLVGKTVVTPQLGNTQDIALKKWLADKQLTDKVKVQNTENALALEEFKKGSVQAAWLPEPWSSRLVLEAGAKVLLDEKDLWPGGEFPTTVLIVSTTFLNDHPETVKGLLKGLVASVDYTKKDTAGAKTAVNAQLKALTGKELNAATIDRAFTNLSFTLDPYAALLPQLSKDAVTAKVAQKETDVKGFLDLRLLNEVLTGAGQSAVDAAGLDKK
ncbi:ABC transporter substrate-binding protein [Actinokineospora terrae]|uniref:NitT/TauT family transport system substrate-binding protein n=1 Tax=Actinokineospora terrae TaxID=155974 RepID=A0A1H9QWF8_9PSEU|nr:ABC transporter substrate-binding protein [Actinokineospora terrae]SER64812.1 NitT/TauT family transport system substrate-binding protein [Actinokineospora terrae]